MKAIRILALSFYFPVVTYGQSATSLRGVITILRGPPCPGLFRADERRHNLKRQVTTTPRCLPVSPDSAWSYAGRREADLPQLRERACSFS